MVSRSRAQCTVCHAQILDSEMIVTEVERRFAFCGVCGMEREVTPVDDLAVTVHLDTPATTRRQRQG